MKLRAKVQNHRLVFDQDENWLTNAFFKLEGKNVIVDVEEVKNFRSGKQNRYYYKCVDVLAAETGESPKRLHTILKGLHAPRIETTWNGKSYLIPKSTADMTVGEFVEYFMKVQSEAADLGVILPDPELYGSDLEVNDN